MSTVIVDNAVKEQLRLAAANPPVTLQDEAGEVLGFFSRPTSLRGRVPGMTAKDMEAMFTEEELNYDENDPPPTRTLESVLREIGG